MVWTTFAWLVSGIAILGRELSVGEVVILFSVVSGIGVHIWRSKVNEDRIKEVSSSLHAWKNKVQQKTLEDAQLHTRYDERISGLREDVDCMEERIVKLEEDRR